MSDARREMLARIADALGPAAAVADPARAYRRAGTGAPPGDAQIVERFAERVDDYRARVHRVDRRELAALIVTLVPGSAAVAPAIGALVPAAWLGGDAGRVIDDGTLDVAALRDCGTAVTGCLTAIAESGTIVLDGGPESGRRLITLVPDHHVCVVEAPRIVDTVPDAIEVLRPAALAGRPLTFVSGPSATSDIEFERVEGVHGPRQLDVVIVDG